jgi:hypothetical protein
MCFEGGTYIAPSTYSVTVSLTKPVSASDFQYGDVYASPDGSTDSSGFSPKYVKGEQLASFASASDSVTIDADADAYGIVVELYGAMQPSVAASNITCTGGVSYVGSLTYPGATGSLFQVTGNGTITIDGIDYGD